MAFVFDGTRFTVAVVAVGLAEIGATAALARFVFFWTARVPVSTKPTLIPASEVDVEVAMLWSGSWFSLSEII